MKPAFVALLAVPLAVALAARPALADPNESDAPSAPPATAPSTPSVAPAPTTTPADLPARGSVVSALAAVGFGSLVLGGVSLGVSIGFGAKYLGDRSAAYDVCAPQTDGTLVCPASIERLHDTAQADGAVAITTLALGLAFAGLGTTLVIVDASRPRAVPRVAVVTGPGAIALRGAFE